MLLCIRKKNVQSWFIWPVAKLLLNMWGVTQSLRPCPASHYAGRIWKHTFISPVRPFIHHGNANYQKVSSNWRNLKIPPFLFHVTGKHFKNEGFQKWLIAWCDNLVNSLTEISSNTNPKWLVIVVFLNLSSVAWMENIWCVVRVKHLFSNPCGIVYMGPECVSIFLYVK